MGPFRSCALELCPALNFSCACMCSYDEVTADVGARDGRRRELEVQAVAQWAQLEAEQAALAAHVDETVSLYSAE